MLGIHRSRTERKAVDLLSSTMRKNAGRTGAAVAALAMGLAMSPAIANAEDAPVGGPGLKADDKVLTHLKETYQDDGPIPVAFWAEGNDKCEVTFTVVNRTASDKYHVDYVIDDEKAPEHTEEDHPTGKTYDFKKLTAGPYSGTEIGERTIGRIGVRGKASGTSGPVSNAESALRAPETTTNTVKLKELKDLPNPEADKHVITYQQINGPVRGDFGIQSNLPVFTTEVTGCATPDPLGSLGSSDSAGSPFGSMFGSLFGSLGSNDAKLGSS